MSNDPPQEDHSKDDPSKSNDENAQHLEPRYVNLYNQHRERLPTMVNQLRVYTSSHLFLAGFRYTGDGDTARCDYCKLEVSNWTLDIDPFRIHSEQKPDCPFVLVGSVKVSSSSNALSSASSSPTPKRNLLTSSEHENISKRQKTETVYSESLLNLLFKTDLFYQIQRRTFSHWRYCTIQLTEQMIDAGFFYCNIADRVICLYCNLICQQWTPSTDDPCEVHRTLSPNCMYVKTKLTGSEPLKIINTDESSTGATVGVHSPRSDNFYPLQSHGIVFTAAQNSVYFELPKRLASFATWPHKNLPLVDDLGRAGFFYTGEQTIVSCFYCNGAIQNWGPNDNPLIEHARWFPHCAYAKQLCGDELHRQIQEAHRVRQERPSGNKSKENMDSSDISNSNLTTKSRQLSILDENNLSALVADRLKLPMSQDLSNQNFKLAIIQRCWEDQLRLKKEDFVSEYDLYVACVILQKQIEHIDGKKENITIPSIKMKQIREQNEARMREPISDTTDVDMTTSSQSLTNESTSSQSSVESVSKPTTDNQGETKIIKPTTSTAPKQDQSTSATPSNPCVLCLTKEKRLACIPCGHLATCVPCGRSLRSCPICRREIEAFVRIYT